jgi:uncharacterized protein (TIRG00374 family)
MSDILDFLKKHKKAITNILTVIVLILTGYYLYRNREIFSSLKNLEPKYLVYISILQIAVVAITALINKLAIKILEIEINFRESFQLQYANAFLNKLVSEGGAVFRGYFLKEIYNLPYTRYVSTIAGFYVVSFLGNSIIGLICLTYIYLVYNRINYLILILLSLLLISMIVLLFINPRIKNKKGNRVLKWVNNILKGWERIKEDRKMLTIFIFLTVLILFLSAFQTIFVYKGLGTNLGFFESLYMTSIGIISTFVNITPDSIGVKEGVYMFSSQIIGMDSDIILLGALIIRAVALINTFLIGGFSYLRLSSSLRLREEIKESKS